MRSVVGSVVIGGGIIIDENDFSHICLGTRCR